MPDTCKIDGQIEEVRRLLDQTDRDRAGLNSRLNSLLCEKREMLEEEPLKVLKKAMGNAGGVRYVMNGQHSPQMEFAMDNVTVYNYSLSPIIPYPLRGIEVKNGVIRLCFDSSKS